MMRARPGQDEKQDEEPQAQADRDYRGCALKLLLDALKASYEDAGRPLPATILLTERGQSWTSTGLRTSWREACAKAGIADLTFHDLRGTVVTRLAIAGASVQQIATITGHSLKDVEPILDAHYLNRNFGMEETAISKLEKRGKM
ncbi:tyrosine-type recombinase/integrase [Sphingomonas sp. CD22]|uniref:tyrosine-type recombinase/integrase n=1 Tax=Sphingomonas sp. CD22 TaxID=3100214 RepID=UPI002AE022DE|nr:tyrosine-type recombinase/integrase [Sphingomonas sp. CD22]MEA1084842.1 tyrosine-type recombinase/integrase [Sphingomonas sp. CD22]